MPPALKSKIIDGEEVTQGLPPYKRATPYPVDEYTDCPEDWIHGSDKASSYFLAAQEGMGVWLDFNPCTSHTHDVAVVVSVQKINPLTGQESESFALEKYGKKCPLHDCDFQQDRFCPECKFKWPAQNYLATTGTPKSMFWLDGFRNEEGKVRQYIMTAEKMRGVAANLIGDKRVYAIGVAFYLSKKPKPVPEYSGSVLRGRSVLLMDLEKSAGISGYDGYHGLTKTVVTPQWSMPNTDESSEHTPIGASAMMSLNDEGNDDVKYTHSINQIKADVSSKYERDRASVAHVISRGGGVPDQLFEGVAAQDLETVDETKLEIGAGAAIAQQVYADPKDLDYWEAEPAGFIYINYVNESKCNKILKAGRRKESKEGFLAGLPVGNR